MGGTRIKIQLDPVDKILLKRNLSKSGKAQRFFTHEVKRKCDPYVPMDRGTMKDTAVESVDKIINPQVYSRRQYYENKGNGKRGKEWDKRMMADQGKDIVSSVAKFVGGKVK